MFNLFKKTAIKRTIFFMVSDVFFIALSVWLAFLLRFDGKIPENYFPVVIKLSMLAVLFTIPVFYLKKLYFFSWSYVSASEAMSLVSASAASFVIFALALYFLRYTQSFANFPRSIVFISYPLIFILCGGLRFSKRIYLRLTGPAKMEEKKRTLIVGAGDAGEQILRSILSSGAFNYWPVGFVDDNPIKKGVMIHGLKVFGTIDSIPEIIQEQSIKQIIIALPSAGNRVIKKALGLGKIAGVKKIKIVPPLNEMIKNQFSFRNLRDVGVEDLLGREEIVLDTRQIEDSIKNRKILVTGAAGSIGSELCRQIAKFKPSLLFILDQDESGIFGIENELAADYPEIKVQSSISDVTDKEKILNILSSFKPAIVFHAAAYKHVPLMESDPREAAKNNVFGTKVLAEASIENGVERFIFISTDKAVNPRSVMGATKRIGEMICQGLNQKNKTKFISVRFGNVLNSRGSVIPIFKEQIRRGGPVEVTHPDMKRYFMLTSEACLLVMQAGAMGNGGEVFVLDMGEPVKILDLAKEMIKLSGLELDKDIVIVYSGIRPGEKMFEEILTAEEGTVSTKNKKIFMTKLRNVDYEKLERDIKDLEKTPGAETNRDKVFDIVDKTFKL